MKRVNIKEAFVGEPNPNQEGLNAAESGNDAVEYKVESGAITLIVPPNVSDPKVMLKASGIQGELKLEGGRQVTFWIYEDAENAGFMADETARPEPTEPGQGMTDDLSTAYEDSTAS